MPELEFAQVAPPSVDLYTPVPWTDANTVLLPVHEPYHILNHTVQYAGPVGYAAIGSSKHTTVRQATIGIARSKTASQDLIGIGARNRDRIYDTQWHRIGATAIFWAQLVPPSVLKRNTWPNRPGILGSYHQSHPYAITII